jgi:hypothetical protein
MLNPKPLLELAILVVKNGSKMCAKWSSGMPHPVSATEIWM